MVKIKNETNQADLSIPTLSDTDEVSVGKENRPILVNFFYSIINNFCCNLPFLMNLFDSMFNNFLRKPEP